MLARHALYIQHVPYLEIQLFIVILLLANDSINAVKAQ